MKLVEEGVRESTWRSDKGSLKIQRPCPHVVVFVESGYLDAEFAPPIEDASNQALAEAGTSNLHLFVDAYDLTGYAPKVRKNPTNWLMAHRNRVEVQHMLVRSKITKMGLSVASLALGGLIQGHSSRAAFQVALDETVRTLRSSFPPPSA
ncbi:MAG: hypothetical protein AAF411_05940 [Myxococcota bacterium]